MRVRKNPMIPLTAVAAGLLAGAVGTVCLDAVHYLKYRRGGGTDSPAAWEFAPVENWEAAPDPGQVAKRVIEGFTQRKLPDRSAWLISTIAHWGYGSAAGAAYGIVAGSLPRPHPRYGLLLGTALFANDYIALPVAGLYQPIWEYDAKTLAWDLGAHLAYGAGTGTTFWLVTRIGLLEASGPLTSPQTDTESASKCCATCATIAASFTVCPSPTESSPRWPGTECYGIVMVSFSHGSRHRPGRPDRRAKAHPRRPGLATRHEGRHHAVWRRRTTGAHRPDCAPGRGRRCARGSRRHAGG